MPFDKDTIDPAVEVWCRGERRWCPEWLARRVRTKGWGSCDLIELLRLL